MRIVAARLLLFFLFALGGCADSQLAGSLFYLPAYKYEDLDCAALKAKIADATARQKTFGELHDKASTAVGGSTIGTVVYAPDQQRAGWDKRFFEQEYARKQCTDAPPPAPTPPQTAVIPR
jgi:hypothetical protein